MAEVARILRRHCKGKLSSPVNRPMHVDVHPILDLSGFGVHVESLVIMCYSMYLILDPACSHQSYQSHVSRCRSPRAKAIWPCALSRGILVSVVVFNILVLFW